MLLIEHLQNPTVSNRKQITLMRNGWRWWLQKNMLWKLNQHFENVLMTHSALPEGTVLGPKKQELWDNGHFDNRVQFLTDDEVKEFADILNKLDAFFERKKWNENTQVIINKYK